MPNVRQQKKKCGNFLAIIITVVIAAVAIYLTAGLAAPFIAGAVGTATVAGFAATVVLTALAGAAIYAGLNIVQQGLMIAAGLQESFSWGQVRDQAKAGLKAGALAGMGAFAEAAKIGTEMQTIINVSKTALNVANKAYTQMKANDGKITNWSGLLMAAAPAVGDLGFDGAADAIDAYGDYASPWLGLAEQSLNGDSISSDDYLMAVGNTLSAAIGEIGNGKGEDPFSLQNMGARIGLQTVVAGALYDQLDDKYLATDYLAHSVGQELGGLVCSKVSG